MSDKSLDVDQLKQLTAHEICEYFGFVPRNPRQLPIRKAAQPGLRNSLVTVITALFRL